MSISTLEIRGQPFVIIPKREFDELASHLGQVGVHLPAADQNGNRPAIASMLALLAQKLIRRRLALGLSQIELSKLARIRVETISRLESGKHQPQRGTMVRLEKAFEKAARGSENH
jgi:DNA-binding XRE family transcriptional regulator